MERTTTLWFQVACIGKDGGGGPNRDLISDKEQPFPVPDMQISCKLRRCCLGKVHKGVEGSRNIQCRP